MHHQQLNNLLVGWKLSHCSIIDFIMPSINSLVPIESLTVPLTIAPKLGDTTLTFIHLTIQIKETWGEKDANIITQKFFWRWEGAILSFFLLTYDWKMTWLIWNFFYVYLKLLGVGVWFLNTKIKTGSAVIFLFFFLFRPYY